MHMVTGNVYPGTISFAMRVGLPAGYTGMNVDCTVPYAVGKLSCCSELHFVFIVTTVYGNCGCFCSQRMHIRQIGLALQSNCFLDGSIGNTTIAYLAATCENNRMFSMNIICERRQLLFHK